MRTPQSVSVYADPCLSFTLLHSAASQYKTFLFLDEPSRCKGRHNRDHKFHDNQTFYPDVITQPDELRTDGQADTQTDQETELNPPHASQNPYFISHPQKNIYIFFCNA